MDETNIEDAPRGEKFDFNLAPDRVRTEAEIKTFAAVFRISVDEALKIVKDAKLRCQM